MKSQSTSTTTKKTTKKKGSQICTNLSSSSPTQQIASVSCFVLLPSSSSSPTKTGVAKRVLDRSAVTYDEGEISKAESQGLHRHQPNFPIVFRASTDATLHVNATSLSAVVHRGSLVVSSNSRPSSIPRERNEHQRKSNGHQRRTFPTDI